MLLCLVPELVIELPILFTVTVAATYAFAGRYVKPRGTSRPRRRENSQLVKGRKLDDPLVRRRGRLIEAEIDDELIGLEIEQGTCFGFNATATRIWALIETPKRFSELRDALLAEYEVDPATCEAELRTLLGELEADGLVELEPPAK